MSPAKRQEMQEAIAASLSDWMRHYPSSRRKEHTYNAASDVLKTLRTLGYEIALTAPARGDGAEWVTDDAVIDALEKVKRGEKTSSVERGVAVGYELGWRDGYNTSAPAAPAGDEWRPTHRHVKRGTVYQKVGEVTLQTEEPLHDDDRCVLYRDEDGRWWARPVKEFGDYRRFEPLPPAPVEGG